MSRPHIFVRPTVAEDSKHFLETANNTPNNLFDPSIFKSTDVKVFAAYNSNGTILYMPYQRPIFMESLCFDPTASTLDKAAAMKAMTQALVTQAHIAGQNEMYFL